jgi:hypothetical protein
MKYLRLLSFILYFGHTYSFAQTPDIILLSAMGKDTFSWAKVEKSRNEKQISELLKADPSVAVCHGGDQSSWKADIDKRVKNFHLIDLNQDSLLDLIDENTCYKYIRTIVYLKTKEGSFKKVWDKQGRVLDIVLKDKTIITVKKHACCCDNLHEINQLQIDKKSYNANLNIFTNWHFNSDIVDTPQLTRFYKTKNKAILRAKPILNDSLKPYECRDDIKIKGNQIGEYTEGVELKILAERNVQKKKWYFAMIPPNKGVVNRNDYLVLNDGKNYIFGWFLEKDLKK